MLKLLESVPDTAEIYYRQDDHAWPVTIQSFIDKNTGESVVYFDYNDLLGQYRHHPCGHCNELIYHNINEIPLTIKGN